MSKQIILSWNDKGFAEIVKGKLLHKETRKSSMRNDKNGKGIQEYDIVDFKRDNEFSRDIVVIKNNLFTLKYGNCKSLEGYGLSNLEVIGNIFDNYDIVEEIQKIQESLDKANKK